MSHQCILFETIGGVARLTLNRPERLNSFNVTMHTEVWSVLAELAAGSGARVLVITGAGRGFCAGQDLGDRAVAPGGQTADPRESTARYYKPLVLALRQLPMPVIASTRAPEPAAS